MLHIAGIIALVAVIGFSMVACVGDDDSPSTDGDKPHPDTAHWDSYAWDDPSSSVTISHSVANDGVCTITVGGTPLVGVPNGDPLWNHLWKANASYSYTVQAGKLYEYKFEAWTVGADRRLYIEWYGDNDENLHNGSGWEPYNNNYRPLFNITSQRKTYTFNSFAIPKNGEQGLTFQCANQTGTFYVKIISITAVGTGIFLSDFHYYTDNNDKKDGKEDQIKWSLEDNLLKFSQTAKYMVVNLGTAPSGELHLFWQHSGNNWSDWSGSQAITNDNGSAKSGMTVINNEYGGTTIKITLATALQKYSEYVASAETDEATNIGLGYWTGDTQIRALNIQWAYLLKE